MADGTRIECAYKTRHIQTTIVTVVGIRDATHGQSTAICAVCHLCAIATEGINQTCKLNQVAESDVVSDGESTLGLDAYAEEFGVKKPGHRLKKSLRRQKNK